MFSQLLQDFEGEKQKMAKLNRISEQKIILDVGGYKCSTSLQTLQAKPKSMLGIMFSGIHPIKKQNDGSIFIDRDGTHFRIILNYLRGGIASSEQLPDDKFLLSELQTEANYYQLKDLEKMIKSKVEKPSKVITQEELSQVLQSDMKNLSFRNSILDNLVFNRGHFQNFLDLTGSSLINTTFSGCYFSRKCQYSFDRTDLKGCKFKYCFVQIVSGCYGMWGFNSDTIDFIRQKKITFYDAKNIDLADFSNEHLRKVIKETYDL